MKLFQKLEEEGKLSKSFYKAGITGHQGQIPLFNTSIQHGTRNFGQYVRRIKHHPTITVRTISLFVCNIT